MHELDVAIACADPQDPIGYCDIAPFHPDADYPEYEYDALSAERNLAYELVRKVFRLARLDAPHFGSPAWNPLSDLVRPGDTVLLKPNLVKGSHPRDPSGWLYVMTHGSLIRAVADYVFKALAGRGKIIVADAPQTDSSFSEIVRRLALDEIARFYHGKGLRFELIDLRHEEWINRDGVIVQRRRLAQNEYGAVGFDLAQASEFADHRSEGRYYGADYDDREVNYHHSRGRHEYLIAGVAIKCDVIFSLPKLKTHKKAGITAALKNMVGVNADKNWLPHHTEGSPRQGGDEHPSPGPAHRFERAAARGSRTISIRLPGIGTWLHRGARSVGRSMFGDSESVIRSGNWFGNQTVWRMCLDLNKLVLYGNADGTMRDPSPANRRRYYALVDAVVAGEGRGPMNPDPVSSGMVLFGVNPASVDAASAIVMGFDPDRIPVVANAFRCRCFPIVEGSWRQVWVYSNKPGLCGRLDGIDESETCHFTPHFGWRGEIERNRSARACETSNPST